MGKNYALSSIENMGNNKTTGKSKKENKGKKKENNMYHSVAEQHMYAA
jgi:hypothetical protein